MPRRGGELILYADGATARDRAGAGAIALTRRREVLALANRPLPLVTNNEAEYSGLLLALELAASLGASAVEIRLDSEVVVGQMAGRWAVNSPKLKIPHQAACVLARGFQHITYKHIPRELNEVADALATEAAAGRVWRMLRAESVDDGEA
ncbi:MAG: reverse transcriptase-like protein [Anaerolineae bacterium]|nr:reverse transcriptase-like protein [Anaerolineae bacterium]